MNDNQNYFVTRSTSRVLSEPGGKSSVGFLFGGGSTATKVEKVQKATPAEEPKKEVVAAEEVAAVAKKEEEPTKTNGGEDALKSNNDTGDTAAAVNDAMADAQKIKKKNESQSFSIFGGGTAGSPNKESSNAYASAATTNSYNVLTDRPTSRVLRPPGGHSSIKLG